MKFLKQELVQYKNIKDKINRLVKEEKLIRLTKGLYETDKTTPGCSLCSMLCGPSYLSFDFALSYYGLIPEAVYIYTSATFNKQKKKSYNNFFGTYLYQDVPKDVYHLGV